jgi:hypothetical protein
MEPLMTIVNKLANGHMPSPHITMRYELLRLCTFRTYPRENKPYIMLYAKAGFYYASKNDEVVCYVCASRKHNWSADSNPMEIHKEMKPTCDFLIKNSTVNVPISHQTIWETLSVVCHEKQMDPPPKHPKYANSKAREDSFKFTDKEIFKIPIEQIIEAGFFFTGCSDCVRCFYCGLGLRNWENNDDAWVLHAQWGKNCMFLKKIKGENFITLVQFAIQRKPTNVALTPVLQEKTITQINYKMLLDSGTQSEKSINKLLKKTMICVTCENKKANIVFVPCGHLVSCIDCEKVYNTCPVTNCKQFIKGTIKTFLS